MPLFCHLVVFEPWKDKSKDNCYLGPFQKGSWKRFEWKNVGVQINLNILMRKNQFEQKLFLMQLLSLNFKHLGVCYNKINKISWANI